MSKKSELVSAIDNEIISPKSFFMVSVGIFSAGIIAGMQYQLKKESFSLKNNINSKTPFLIACKSLMYGTILCLSVFGVSIPLFCSVAGVNSFKKFEEIMRKALNKQKHLEDYDKMLQADLNEIQEIHKGDEFAYISKQFSDNIKNTKV